MWFHRHLLQVGGNISTNFTTKPNSPGKMIIWFRNETSLLVLWQPPYPEGVYTDYKVSIGKHIPNKPLSHILPIILQN